MPTKPVAIWLPVYLACTLLTLVLMAAISVWRHGGWTLPLCAMATGLLAALAWILAERLLPPSRRERVQDYRHALAGIALGGTVMAAAVQLAQADVDISPGRVLAWGGALMLLAWGHTLGHASEPTPLTWFAALLVQILGVLGWVLCLLGRLPFPFSVTVPVGLATVGTLAYGVVLRLGGR